MQYAILGKAILIMLFCSATSVVSTPDCSLEVRNADGVGVSVVGMGVPFQLVVVVRDCVEQPHVVFDESPFDAIKRVSVQTRSVNGYSTVSYIYSVRIDRVGRYDNIGPAHVTVAGHMYQTNACSIEVGAQEKAVGSRLMMQTMLDDTDIYIGQQTTMRVRVYSATSAPEIESLHIAQLDNVIVGEFTLSVCDSEYQDGVKYWYKEFSAPVYAQIAGTFLIPSFSADIRDDQARRGGFFFFSLIAPTKQIFSNTLALTVRNLPAQSKPSTLIGDYSEVEASVEPSIIELGQAIRYRLTVYGEGNNVTAKAPLLSDMPASCKYYDSSVTPLSNKKGIVFEYVIQPRQAGTWEIPAQEIVYFSTTQKKFCSLYSESVVITANPNPSDVADQQGGCTEHESDSTSSVITTALQQYHPDLSSADPHKSFECILSWFWYWFCIISLWIAFIVLRAGYYTYDVYTKNYCYYRRYCAFYFARRALYALEQGTSRVSLYQIFITLFADLFMVEKSVITEAFIKQYISTAGILSEDGVESWHRFWHTIVQEQFGIVKAREIDKTVYTEARLWITAFSKFGMR